MRRTLRRLALIIAKTVAIIVGIIFTLSIATFLYFAWSVRDTPMQPGLIDDCKNEKPSSSNALVSDSKWRYKALYAIEPNIDSYFSRLLANRSLPAERSVRRILVVFALTATVKIRMTVEDRTDAVLKLHYYGSKITGFSCAASFYFKKHPDELSIAQFALFVGTVRAPTRYDPVKRPQAAQDRRDEVLNRWRELGLISESQATTAIGEKLL
jgi:Transglycosylase